MKAKRRSKAHQRHADMLQGKQPPSVEEMERVRSRVAFLKETIRGLCDADARKQQENYFDSILPFVSLDAILNWRKEIEAYDLGFTL